MKAWPEVLRDRYPLPPGVFPDRPWWRGAIVNLEQSNVVRVDGLRLTRRSRWVDMDGAPIDRAPRGSASPILQIVWGERQTTREEAMAQEDAARPLPFPGLRVGQTLECGLLCVRLNRAACALDADARWFARWLPWWPA